MRTLVVDGYSQLWLFIRGHLPMHHHILVDYQLFTA